MILEHSLNTIADIRMRLQRFSHVPPIEKPIRKHEDLCYIAKALGVRVNRAYISTDYDNCARAIARALWGLDWAQHLYRFHDTWEIDLPPLLQLFVRAFDAGMYPQLEE